METYKIKLSAPAKINYILEIGPKRQDGFHSILTLFQAVSLCDVLHFKETKKDLVLLSNSEDMGPMEKNLVYRAASLLKRISGLSRGAEIYLEKNIPIGAGLGGGSSDAVCALKGLARLWGLRLKKEDYYKFASQLGSDVPFFVDGGMAIGKGRGDKISPVTPGIKPKFSIALICPDINVSSSWAYNAWDERKMTTQGKGMDAFMRCLYKYDARGAAKYLYNDFEPLVFEEYPTISEIKKKLLEGGAETALMTGSGSAVYGIFFDENKLDKAVENLKEYGKSFKINTL